MEMLTLIGLIVVVYGLIIEAASLKADIIRATNRRG